MEGLELADEAGMRLTLVDQFRELLLQSHEVEPFLQEVVDRAAAYITEASAASVTLEVHDHLMTVVSSDPSAWSADQVEYAANSGPCVDTVRDGTLSVVDDLEQDRRWPEWSRAAADLGFRSAIAVPASTDRPAANLALNLYSAQPHAFGEQALLRANLYAQEMAAALRLCLDLAEKELLLGQLQTALVSRSTIDQALGAIMGQNRCTREEAFTILRTASQHRNVKLRDVAASVIENVTGHPPDDPHGFRS